MREVTALVLRLPPLPEGRIGLCSGELAALHRGLCGAPRVLLVNLAVERGRVVEDELHITREEISDPEEQLLLQRLLVPLEEVHRPVEVVQLEPRPTRQPDILAEPLLVAVELGGGSQAAVGHHGEAGPLHGEGAPRVIASQGRQSLRHPDPLPQLLEDIEVAVGPRVQQRPAGAFGDDLLRGDPAQDASRQRAQPLADLGVIGSAEVVDDAGVGSLRRRVPDALRELQVGNRRATGPLLGTLSEEHV